MRTAWLRIHVNTNTALIFPGRLVVFNVFRGFWSRLIPIKAPPNETRLPRVLQSSLHGAALVHAIMGNMSEASASLAQLRSMVEEDWARRRRRRGRTAAVTEGTSHASLIVMETLDAYLAAARVRMQKTPIGFTRNEVHTGPDRCFKLDYNVRPQIPPT